MLVVQGLPSFWGILQPRRQWGERSLWVFHPPYTASLLDDDGEILIFISDASVYR
jgi:hypothetical protein